MLRQTRNAAISRGSRAHYDDEIALLTVEKAAGKGDIEWIDFNIPLGLKGDEFLHLHFVPRTKYTTDVFAYNLIRRGFNHGLKDGQER